MVSVKNLGVFLLAVLPFASHAFAAGAAPTANYWMYVGAYTERGAKGIYLFKLNAKTGSVAPQGLAAGRLWDANSDSFGAGLSRMFAQIRSEWPSPHMMVRGVQNPVYFAVHPSQNFLYTADDIVPGSAVSAYSVDRKSGKLKLLSDTPSAGDEPTYIAVDRAGRNVLVANYAGGNVAVFPIGNDGSLRSPSSVIQQKAGATDPKLRAHPHSINPSPDNQYAVTTDLGLDEVLAYRFNAAKGIIDPNNPTIVRTPKGSGARHLAFHPNGRYAYVIEETGSAVMAMRWDAKHGLLTPLGSAVSTLPPDFHAANGSAEVAVHPNGRFLYGSNRGHDSIAVFAIDPNNGTLTLVQIVSSGGSRPRGFCIDPTGQYLFAANIDSHNVVEFRIDPQTGKLSRTSVTLDVPYPAAVKFVAAM